MVQWENIGIKVQNFRGKKRNTQEVSSIIAKRNKGKKMSSTLEGQMIKNNQGALQKISTLEQVNINQ